ncbi:MAG: MCE family protein [Cytophagaceae bacterium]|nr:MCE family protein [Cytophagaceae bacterium]
MKNEIGNKVKLGIFITAGSVLLLVAIYFIGARQHLFDRTIIITGIFKDANGLMVGNNVRFLGINIGTIEGISIMTDSTVRVDMQIEEDIKKFIKTDSKAIISSEGLMGNKAISLTPGDSGTVIKDGDSIATIKPADMDMIMAKLNKTVDNASLITGDMAVITKNIRNGKGSVGKLFSDTVFAENLDQTLVNLKYGMKGFNANMEAAKHSMLLKGAFKRMKKEERLEKKEEKKEKKEEKEKEKENK